MEKIVVSAIVILIGGIIIFWMESKKNTEKINLLKSDYISDDIPDDFMMEIVDVFAIGRRGTIVMGEIARGSVKEGDTVKIMDDGVLVREVVVSGVEMNKKIISKASMGDKVSILLKGRGSVVISKGQVLMK